MSEYATRQEVEACAEAIKASHVVVSETLSMMRMHLDKMQAQSEEFRGYLLELRDILRDMRNEEKTRQFRAVISYRVNRN